MTKVVGFPKHGHINVSDGTRTPNGTRTPFNLFAFCWVNFFPFVFCRGWCGANFMLLMKTCDLTETSGNYVDSLLKLSSPTMLTLKVVAAIIVTYCDLPNVGPEPFWEVWFLCYLPESPSWHVDSVSGEKLATNIGIHHDSVH